MDWFWFPVPRKTKQSVPWENFTKSTGIHWKKELLLYPRCLVIVLFSQGTILTPSASSWQQLTMQTPNWCVLSTTGADFVELWNATFSSVILKRMQTFFLVVWTVFQKTAPFGTKGSRFSCYWTIEVAYWITCVDINKALLWGQNIPLVIERYTILETTKWLRLYTQTVP